MKNPETLEEAVSTIVDAIKSSEHYNWVIEAPEKDVLAETHHGYGRTLRNEFGLWQDSALKQELMSLGFTHPDDMSASLIKFAIRDIKGLSRDVEKEVQYYKDYWANQKENSNTVIIS